MKKEEILEEAKKIMDDFVKELDSIELDEDFGIEREKETRTKFESVVDKDFRERVFKNAPKIKDEFIVAEKKDW